MPHSLFRSFFQGGFESATHRRRDRQRVDVIAQSQHDLHCETDYRLLATAGVFTVRDALRWHLIERSPGVFDWSSVEAQLHASLTCRTQVLWDLCHWGVPDNLNPFDREFAPRFAAFAAAFAAFLRDFHRDHQIAETPTVCPINEMSFWSWVGGDVELFYPFGRGRGDILKHALAAAANAAIRAMREVCPAIRIVQPEPLIHITADPRRPQDTIAAARHNQSQFAAWDMLLGRSHPELGGGEDHIDVLGVNYYWNNQWIHNGTQTPPGHPLHVPLHQLLQKLWDRYRKPIFLSETGAEGAAGPGWLAYIMGEVRQAQHLGVPVEGVCLYPAMDYPGWDDNRHCPVGLIAVDAAWNGRSWHSDLLLELQAQQRLHSMPKA